jgi:hypothetical protein
VPIPHSHSDVDDIPILNRALPQLTFAARTQNR